MSITKTKREKQKILTKQTPEEVPIGTRIILRKTNFGWVVSRLKNNSWDRITKSDKNIILALKKVIGIY